MNVLCVVLATLIAAPLLASESGAVTRQKMSKKKKKLEKFISELNTNTDWIRHVDSFDDFQKQLAFRQENIESKVEAVNMSEFFKSELTRLFDSCTPILSKKDL